MARTTLPNWRIVSAAGRGGVPPLSLAGHREGRYWLVGDVATRPAARCSCG
jgi:hypothetical protein